jgi:hypothetical protein
VKELITFGGNQPLLDALVRVGVRFLVVGGGALRWHIPDRPIGSNDLDMLIESTVTNAAKVTTALAAIGLAGSELTPERLAQPRNTQVSLKVGGLWADIITNPELPFQKHWDRAECATMFGVTVKVASLQTMQLLLATSSEPKHAEDLALLERVLGRRSSREA